MWVTLIRVYAAKAIDNEYAYGRLNAGQPDLEFKYALDLFLLFFFLQHSLCLAQIKHKQKILKKRRYVADDL